MDEAFSRTALLLGSAAMEKLAESRVAVFGLGGVGGYAVEALARSGLGALDLIDRDSVSVTNLNRQILATRDSIGQDKAELAARRVLSINPACRVESRRCFYLPENREEFDLRCYDYVLDAMDTVSAKLALALQAQEAGVPIISAMGAGNKLDAQALRVADLYRSSGCPLARIMRREGRRLGIERLKVVYSPEPPRRPLGVTERTASDRPVPASTAFVPAVMGLLMAGEAVRDLTAALLPGEE